MFPKAKMAIAHINGSSSYLDVVVVHGEGDVIRVQRDIRGVVELGSQ